MTGCSLASPHLVDLSAFAVFGSQSSGENQCPLRGMDRHWLDKWGSPCRNGGPDVFAHFSAITMDGFKTLKEGALVSYEVSQGPKGLLAQNIRTAEPDPAALPAQGYAAPMAGEPPPMAA
jgi:CspA family cold shock protein